MDFSLYPKDDLGKFPPGPKLNAGLYTGEPFKKDAPWGSIYIPASTHTYINESLRSAGAPESALYQYPNYVRPGNNWQEFRGLQINKTHGVDIPCVKKCKNRFNPKYSSCKPSNFVQF